MTEPLNPDPALVIASSNAAPAEPASPSGVVDAAASPVSPAVVEAPAAPALAESLLETFDKERAAESAAEPAAKPDDKPAADGKAPDAVKDSAKPVEPAKPVDGAKPAETPAAAPVAPAPIVYDFKLPDTLTLDEAGRSEVTKAFDDFRTDPAKGVQGLVDLHAKKMQEFADASLRRQYEVFNDTRKGWVKDVMADEQLGGSGHRSAMGAIARMRDMFVSDKDRPAFEQMLRVTGAGDHPQFLKLLHNVARAYDEPPLPPANGKPTPTNGQPPKRGMASLYNSNK